MASLASVQEFVSRLGRRWTIAQKANAFRLTFFSPQGKDFVLPDLVEFTGFLDEAPKNSDLFMQGRAAGRRDVMLHIQEFLRLTDDELYALYAGRATLNKQNFRR